MSARQGGEKNFRHYTTIIMNKTILTFTHSSENNEKEPNN
jgi:hypothetical protein